MFFFFCKLTDIFLRVSFHFLGFSAKVYLEGKLSWAPMCVRTWCNQNVINNAIK